MDHRVDGAVRILSERQDEDVAGDDVERAGVDLEPHVAVTVDHDLDRAAIVGRGHRLVAGTDRLRTQAHVRSDVVGDAAEPTRGADGELLVVEGLGSQFFHSQESLVVDVLAHILQDLAGLHRSDLGHVDRTDDDIRPHVVAGRELATEMLHRSTGAGELGLGGLLGQIVDELEHRLDPAEVLTGVDGGLHGLHQRVVVLLVTGDVRDEALGLRQSEGDLGTSSTHVSRRLAQVFHGPVGLQLPSHDGDGSQGLEQGGHGAIDGSAAGVDHGHLELGTVTLGGALAQVRHGGEAAGDLESMRSIHRGEQGGRRAIGLLGVGVDEEREIRVCTTLTRVSRIASAHHTAEVVGRDAEGLGGDAVGNGNHDRRDLDVVVQQVRVIRFVVADLVSHQRQGLDVNFHAGTQEVVGDQHGSGAGAVVGLQQADLGQLGGHAGGIFEQIGVREEVFLHLVEIADLHLHRSEGDGIGLDDLGSQGVQDDGPAVAHGHEHDRRTHIDLDLVRIHAEVLHGDLAIQDGAEFSVFQGHDVALAGGAGGEGGDVVVASVGDALHVQENLLSTGYLGHFVFDAEGLEQVDEGIAGDVAVFQRHLGTKHDGVVRTIFRHFEVVVGEERIDGFVV